MNKKIGLFGAVLAAALMAFGLPGCQSPVDAERSKQEGGKFLNDNLRKPGVRNTPSGLQYEVLKEGTGARPTATDMVTVNYRGSLVDGNQFDSGDGISFPLNGVIPGWTEGLQLMQEGAQYRFVIPPELAYGEQGAGRVIPPNATLIFEVELVKVGKP
jgi:FKBP-type peptidyl-prolyl cis-trans isomerase